MAINSGEASPFTMTVGHGSTLDVSNNAWVKPPSPEIFEARVEGLELAAFGYVPGNYTCVCRDCPADEPSFATLTNRNQFQGAKFSMRCERHAREARVRNIEERLKAQFNIGHAIALMRAGSRVTRAGWNGKGQWIEIQFPDAGSKMTLPYIYMRTVTGDLVPWLASQTDILANDWMVANG